MNAQDIESLKWENRVLLVLSDSPLNNLFKNQIQELHKDIKGLNERKLKVFQIHKDFYRIGLELDSKIHKSENLYNNYHKEDSDLEVILIGLDGGVKLRQEELLTLESLFATIDEMPMRRREMKNQK